MEGLIMKVKLLMVYPVWVEAEIPSLPEILNEGHFDFSDLPDDAQEDILDKADKILVNSGITPILHDYEILEGANKKSLYASSKTIPQGGIVTQRGSGTGYPYNQGIYDAGTCNT